jgi:hypothetical protein
VDLLSCVSGVKQIPQSLSVSLQLGLGCEAGYVSTVNNGTDDIILCKR